MQIYLCVFVCICACMWVVYAYMRVCVCAYSCKRVCRCRGRPKHNKCRNVLMRASVHSSLHWALIEGPVDGPKDERSQGSLPVTMSSQQLILAWGADKTSRMPKRADQSRVLARSLALIASLSVCVLTSLLALPLARKTQRVVAMPCDAVPLTLERTERMRE